MVVYGYGNGLNEKGECINFGYYIDNNRVNIIGGSQYEKGQANSNNNGSNNNSNSNTNSNKNTNNNTNINNNTNTNNNINNNNNQNNKLPQTGGKNVMPIVAFAAIMILGGAMVIKEKKKVS